MVVRLCFLDGSLYLFYIMELAVLARDILELVTYQPDILQAGCLQLVNHLLVFLMTYLSELAHLSENRILLGTSIKRKFSMAAAMLEGLAL